MARIRSVKPEFWEDESVGALSPLARLLFIGSWNLADDEGILRWTADYLNASLFMYDSLTAKRVAALMQEVEAAGLVFCYEPTKGGRQKLAYVVNFRRHQKINRPQPGKFQPPCLTSERVRLMYAERDAWTCHLCRGPINTTRAGQVIDGTTVEGSASLNLSIDHVIPVAAGGDDQPSNVRACHVGCNKSRRDKPVGDFSVPDSVSRSLPHSLNEHGTFTEDSLRARKEMDQGMDQGDGDGSDYVAAGADDGAAQALIAEWIDHCSQRPPKRVIGQTAREIKILLDEGIPPADVRRGLAAWHAKGLHPSALASVVHETRTHADRRRTSPPTTDQRVGDALALAARYAAEDGVEIPQIGA